MTDTVLAQLAALKTAPIPVLKEQWRDLFDREPPPYNRKFLESRLAYRIQELAYGGLKKETIERLEALGEQLDGGKIAKRRHAHGYRPIAGTRLIREWQGVEHCVTVGSTTSSIRAGPTRACRRSPAPSPGRDGTAGSSSASRASGAGDDEASSSKHRGRPQAPLRGLHPQEHRGRARHGVQLPRCPAGGLRGLRREPEGRGWILVPDRYDDGGFSGGTLERPGLQRLLADIERGKVDVVVVYKIDRLSRSLMDFAKLVEVFDRHEVTFVSVTQAFNTTTSMGQADPQHASVLRPVRARGDRRAHPRQVRRLAQKGHVDGWLGAARLRRQGP